MRWRARRGSDSRIHQADEASVITSDFAGVGGVRLPKRVAGRLIASSTSLVLPVAARTSETDGDLRGRRVTGRVSLIRACRYQAPAPAEAHYFDFPYRLVAYSLKKNGERCGSIRRINPHKNENLCPKSEQRLQKISIVPSWSGFSTVQCESKTLLNCIRSSLNPARPVQPVGISRCFRAAAFFVRTPRLTRRQSPCNKLHPVCQ